MDTVLRPPIPYRDQIRGGLHQGKRIKIKGLVPYGADRFTVNLMTGMDPNSDRPLHISVRFDGKVVVRNTLIRNSYGSEERNGSFPFSEGQSFTLTLRIENHAYKINVNGQHLCDYSHRIPFSRVTSIFIDGSVQIDRIEYMNFPPVRRPASVSPTVTPNYPSFPGISTSPLPCTFPIYGGIRPGMTVYISGRPTTSPQRFAVNFQNGTSSSPAPDIAFHFDVRFQKSNVVRNSRIKNAWALEETSISHFPFRQGMNFDMVINVQNDAFVVNVNGQNFISFRHRQHTFSLINTLYIENDVIISSIRYT